MLKASKDLLKQLRNIVTLNSMNACDRSGKVLGRLHPQMGTCISKLWSDLVSKELPSVSVDQLFNVIACSMCQAIPKDFDQFAGNTYILDLEGQLWLTVLPLSHQ